MKRCLVADDHAMMRAALAGVIAVGWPDAEVVVAADFPSACAALAESLPDLIVSDLVMPGAGPLEGISRLRAAAPGVPVMVITGNEDEGLLMALFDAGVAGFASKTASAAVIEAAIRLVLAGGRYLPPALLGLAGARAGQVVAVAPRIRLTERQHDILKLVAQGRSNKEIARELELSPATIKTHAAALLAALGATSRGEAVFIAREAGLL